MTTDPKDPDLCKVIIACQRKSKQDDGHLHDSRFDTWQRVTLHQTNKVIGRTYIADAPGKIIDHQLIHDFPFLGFLYNAISVWLYLFKPHGYY